MRHSRCPLVVFLVALVLAACAAEPDDPPDAISWDEAQLDGAATLTAWYVPAGGFAYADDGRLTGVTVEILRTFAAWVDETHGVEVTLAFTEEPDWSVFYDTVAAADEGTVGMGNVTITEERRTELDFSPPYLENVAVLISHADDPELSSFNNLPEDFADHTLLAFEGTLHEERLRALREAHAPELDLAFASSNDAIVEAVADGGHLAYIDVYNYHRAREAGAPLQRHAVGDDAAEAFGYILPPGSSWTPVLEGFFQETDFTATAAYRQILETHLGAEVAALLLDAS